MAEVGEAVNPNSLSIETPKEIPEALKNEYKDKKVEVEELYSKVRYWHGTGRKQYRDGQVADVLERMVKDGGLIPHRDPFDTRSGAGQTVSLSNRRMYSGGYAKMHLVVGENLEYEYMSSEFWGIFLENTIREAMGRNKWETALKAGKILWSHLKERKNPAYLFNIAKSARRWASKVTKEPYSEPMSKVFTVHSDIPGNYPILVGVKDGAFTPTQTAEFISLYETRSTTAIPFSGFTHIEVPQAHIQETQDYLNQRGIENLPIIAMELGEVHSSQFSPQQLIEGNPFKGQNLQGGSLSAKV